jgi:hypothetical protein
MTPRNPKHPPVQLQPWKPASVPPRTTRELAALRAKHAVLSINLRDHDRAERLGMTTAAYQLWRRRRLAETAPSAPPARHYRSASDMPLAEASAYYGVPAPRVAAARSRAARRRR